MLTSTALKKKLGISDSTFRRIIKEGLPFTKQGRCRKFDMPTVNAWLYEKGYAKKPEKIAKTYAELARELGMTSRDPNRTIGKWAVMPGWPGRAGVPGKQAAYLPVEKIREWLAERGSDADTSGDSELAALRREQARLQLEVSNRELHASLGRLADVDEVAQFNRQCVSDAMSMLEPLADEVVDLLPSSVRAATRRSVHKAVTEMLDNARESIARIIEGDTDEEESDADE